METSPTIPAFDEANRHGCIAPFSVSKYYVREIDGTTDASPCRCLLVNMIVTDKMWRSEPVLIIPHLFSAFKKLLWT